ncbi:Mu transposase C-terminal domain-containing protein [Embleya sp. NBC_00888]|uniref:Mu transposase C-terminal domain-containing protein n=1 Tax=Embleya sp. NBC_00888 TaxID=2975960 RepID=UPI003869A926
MARLTGLEARGALTPEHLRLAAAAAGKSPRTLQRWLQTAREEGRTTPRPRPRFTITADLHARLALWGGNAAAVHRELIAEAHAAATHRTTGTGDTSTAPPDVPSLATLQRAIRRDVNTGQRAAFKGGERARRLHDVHLARPRQWRNACWEADHKHLPVQVELEGELVTPWVTWFIDCATGAVPGAAVTPHTPSRDAILAALRIAMSRDEPDGPYGPIGGLPELVRVDRGKDFLSRTVTTALGAFAVPVHDLPPYRPDLKGTVENLNACVASTFCIALPGHLHTPTTSLRARPPKTAPTHVLPFVEFTSRLLDWIAWWNTEHHSQAHAGTPLQAWNADPTPIEDVPPDLLWAFTLEDDGRTRTLTTKGIRWRGRDYVGPWMHGKDGIRVRLRYIPHHDHEIEVFDATTHAHLGRAHLADQATATQRAALRRAKDAERRTLAHALAEADRQRRRRYAAVTTATAPRQLGALTAAQAEAELTRSRQADLASRALPDLIPPREPPTTWARPRTRQPAASDTNTAPTTGDDTGERNCDTAPRRPPSPSEEGDRHEHRDTQGPPAR